MQFIAILHNIRSVHNVGSIFRTADGAGFKHIYCCGVTPTPLDRFGKIRKDFAKVSLGAEKYLDWEYARTTAGVIKKLKAEGYKIFALEQDKDALPYDSVILNEVKDPLRVALVVGNEVRGLPPSILKLADTILEIPMRGKKESLNVSVSFGIAAYELASLSSRA